MADPEATPEEGDADRLPWAGWTDPATRRRAVVELALRGGGLVAVGVLVLALAAIARMLFG